MKDRVYRKGIFLADLGVSGARGPAGGAGYDGIKACENVKITAA